MVLGLTHVMPLHGLRFRHLLETLEAPVALAVESVPASVGRQKMPVFVVGAVEASLDR